MTVILSSFRARQEAHERDLAIEALKVANGYISAAAKLCGLSRSRFADIVHRYDLTPLLNSRRGRPPGGNAAWRALADV